MVVVKPSSPVLHVNFLKNDVSGAPTDAEIAATGFTPTDGLQCLNTLDRQFYFRSGGVWNSFGSGIGGGASRRQVPPTYIVWYDGTLWHADSMNAGSDFSNADGATTLNNALSNLTIGRTWKEKVVVKGKMSVTTSITIPSFASLDLSDALLQADGGGLLAATAYYCVLQFGSVSQSLNTSEVFGGVIDGNLQNVRGVLFQSAGTTLSDSLLFGSKVINCGRDAGVILEGVDNVVDSVTVDSLTPGVGGTFGGVFVTGVNTTRCRVLHCTVRNGVRNANSTANGFVADDGTSRITWDDCFAYNNAGSGFLLVASAGTHAKEWGIFNSRSINNRNATSIPKGFFIQYCDGLQISNCHASTNSSSGIHTDNCPDANILGSLCKNNGQDSNLLAGILYANAAGGIMVGNRCFDDQGAGQTQEYGITLGTGSSFCTVDGNDLRGNKTLPINFVATANHLVGINQGYTTGTTGAGVTALGSNCPAITPTSVFTWIKQTAPDGSTVYIPAWK